MKLSRLALFACLPAALLAQEPPKLRLPDGARPLRYAVDLTLQPSEASFTGRIDIDVALDAKTPVLWLNASDLKVTEASFKAVGPAVSAKVVPGGKDFVGFAFDPPLAAGKGRLSVSYSGEVNRKDTSGVFAQKEAGDWYLYTQFESTDARRAFPCFDEPARKVPWQVTLRVNRDLVAVSNTPIVSEAAIDGGMKKVVFAETKPLPSYLIAFGVGPFDVVDAGKAGRNHVPVRILTPRGKGAEAAYATQVTGELLTRLEDYFGIPYPYEKLDNLAIPTTVGFGAMENAGLITWASNLILAKPEKQTIGFLRTYASISAHESAHQWFGDLVTMAWWDDLWLNESFATWMAGHIIDKWKPEWAERTETLAGRTHVMQGDTLVSARKIHQPIQSKDDIANAFDGITYGKGGAVLSTFESYLGEAAFRRGVQRYLKKHAFGNATAKDFVDALSAEGGPWVTPSFFTFLDQPGVPLVSAALSCSGPSPTLRLSQQRFLPKSSKGSRDQTWQIPLCYRTDAGGTPTRACAVMTERTVEIPLGGGKSCPSWVVVNDGAAGYFRVRYEGDLLARLTKDGAKPLSLDEKVNVVNDASALVVSGDLPKAEALQLVPLFSKDPSRHLVSASVEIAASIDSNLVTDELRPNYIRFIQKSFGERARALGFSPKAGESEETKLFRQEVVPVVANLGQDPTLIDEGKGLARAWLKDRKAVDPNITASVLRAGARNGGAELFDLYLAEAKATQDRRERGQLFGALAQFRDPALVARAQALTLSDDFDPREAMSVLWSSSGERHSRQAAFDFVRKNFDALAARLPRDYPGNLPWMGVSFCDDAHRAEIETFFQDRAASYTGGPRTLAQALEAMSLCSASRREQQESVNAFLKAY